MFRYMKNIPLQSTSFQTYWNLSLPVGNFQWKSLCFQNITNFINFFFTADYQVHMQFEVRELR